jgi:putative FmdB family regulatory protein
MPLYTYKCTKCKRETIEFQKMADKHLTVCPICRTKTYRRIPSLPNTDLKEFHTPIEMYSIAMDDDAAIRKFIGDCPDVDVSTDKADPMYGVPVARSRRDKRQALKSAEFVETN